MDRRRRRIRRRGEGEKGRRIRREGSNRRRIRKG